MDSWLASSLFRANITNWTACSVCCPSLTKGNGTRDSAIRESHLHFAPSPDHSRYIFYLDPPVLTYLLRSKLMRQNRILHLYLVFQSIKCVWWLWMWLDCVPPTSIKCSYIYASSFTLVLEYYDLFTTLHLKTIYQINLAHFPRSFQTSLADSLLSVCCNGVQVFTIRWKREAYFVACAIFTLLKRKMTIKY